MSDRLTNESARLLSRCRDRINKYFVYQTSIPSETVLRSRLTILVRDYGLIITKMQLSGRHHSRIFV
jgi:hypothetical protein